MNNIQPATTLADVKEGEVFSLHNARGEGSLFLKVAHMNSLYYNLCARLSDGEAQYLAPSTPVTIYPNARVYLGDPAAAEREPVEPDADCAECGGGGLVHDDERCDCDPEMGHSRTKCPVCCAAIAKARGGCAMNADLRSALVKCARRMPGESVTLTDAEIRELLTDQHRGGAEEALEQVSTAMVRRLHKENEDLQTEIERLRICARAIEGVTEWAGGWPMHIDEYDRRMDEIRKYTQLAIAPPSTPPPDDDRSPPDAEVG